MGKNHSLLLPYKVEKREHLIKYLKRRILRLLPIEIKRQSTCFNIKEPSKFRHQHDVVYYVDCTNERCRENYIGENGRRISERIKDHDVRDLKHIF